MPALLGILSVDGLLAACPGAEDQHGVRHPGADGHGGVDEYGNRASASPGGARLVADLRVAEHGEELFLVRRLHVVEDQSVDFAGPFIGAWMRVRERIVFGNSVEERIV